MCELCDLKVLLCYPTESYSQQSFLDGKKWSTADGRTRNIPHSAGRVFLYLSALTHLREPGPWFSFSLIGRNPTPGSSFFPKLFLPFSAG